MSQSSLASSTASGCASTPSSTGSAAVLAAWPLSSATDMEDTTATASATTSASASSLTDGDADASAPPVLRDDVWSLAALLSDPSTVTTTIAAAADAPYQAPEALPSLQPLPSIDTAQLRGFISNATGTVSTSCAMPLQTVLPALISPSHDDPGDMLAAPRSSPPRAPSSAASSSVASDASTSQHGVASSLSTIALAPSPESPVPFVPVVAADQAHHSEIPGPSPAGALSTTSASSPLSQPRTTADATRIVACDYAEPTTREERFRLGLSPSIEGAVTSPAIRGAAASPRVQSATHSLSATPLTLDATLASTPEEDKVAVPLPRAGNGDHCVAGGGVLLGTTEARVALDDTAIAEPALSLSSVAVKVNAGAGPQAEGGASFEAPKKTTPLLMRPADAPRKLTIPTVSMNSDIGGARQDGNDDCRWLMVSVEPPVMQEPEKAPPASRKRRRAALAGPNRQPRRPAQGAGSEAKAAEEVEPARSLSAQPNSGLLHATAAAGEAICHAPTLIKTYAPAAVSAAVQGSGGEEASDEKRLDVLRPPGVAHERDAGDMDVCAFTGSNTQEELPGDAHQYGLRRVRADYGAQAETAEDSYQTEAPVVSCSGKEASVTSPPPSPVAAGASTAAARATATPLPGINLTTETPTPTAAVHNAKPKRGHRGAQGTAAASRKDSEPGALTKEAGAPASFLPASSRPVLNLAGVNVQALLAEGTDPPPLYTRRQRRTRRRSTLAEDHPLFAEHRDLWEHDTAGRILPRAPFASDADVLNSLTEWTDSPALVYAQLLWRYAPALFVNLAMHDSDATPYVKVEPKVEADTRVKQEKME
ncbi:hypothetical protein conserved [Leishmania donovani]|uniref:Hypothetical_protein_conserved n=1 Tax=Leishmania donovani TaxID=5661 RepID=A0A504X5A2_LEIDO|nr:hypothetical protein CGC20_6840 [Leishmania donovani]CAJ1990975.1 hypothetical protein conserved [Leishmania donovani]VDZ46823.1 hypothetical_protein_conserved [Leishmania donovani]